MAVWSSTMKRFFPSCKEMMKSGENKEVEIGSSLTYPVGWVGTPVATERSERGLLLGGLRQSWMLHGDLRQISVHKTGAPSHVPSPVQLRRTGAQTSPPQFFSTPNESFYSISFPGLKRKKRSLKLFFTIKYSERE